MRVPRSALRGHRARTLSALRGAAMKRHRSTSNDATGVTAGVHRATATRSVEPREHLATTATRRTRDATDLSIPIRHRLRPRAPTTSRRPEASSQATTLGDSQSSLRRLRRSATRSTATSPARSRSPARTQQQRQLQGTSRNPPQRQPFGALSPDRSGNIPFEDPRAAARRQVTWVPIL